MANTNDPIESDSQHQDSPSDLRSEFQQNINGRVIRADRIDGHVFVTLDGKPFNGTFIQAIQVASQLPIRWTGMFD